MSEKSPGPLPFILQALGFKELKRNFQAGDEKRGFLQRGWEFQKPSHSIFHKPRGFCSARKKKRTKEKGKT